MPSRVFLDTSVLIRYFAEDDPPRAFAAATLIESVTQLVISTGVLIEAIHVLRTRYGIRNPELAQGLIDFLARDNIEVSDADRGHLTEGLQWSLRASGRHIPDAILAAAAEQAACDWIATFDEGFSSPSVPSRLI